MKRYFLSLSLLVGSIGAANAQTTGPVAPAPAPAATQARPDSSRSEPSGFVLGLTAGNVFSSFLGSDATAGQGAQLKPGYHAGLTADFHLSESLAFHPEVLYVLKGSAFDRPAAGLTRNLHYLEVPLLLRYYTDEVLDANSWFLEVGPQVSYLLQARNENGTDVRSELNRFDAGVNLGAGHRFKSGISLGVRYGVGVLNVYKKLSAAESGGRGDYQPNAKNDTILLSFGFVVAGK